MFTTTLRRCTLCSSKLLPRTVTTTTTRSTPSLLLRTLATTSSTTRPRVTTTTTPLHRRTIIIKAQPPENPTQDWEPVEEGEDLIDLSESAMGQIARAQAKAQNPNLALRVSVESGGCHGYQYKMEVTTHREEDDYLFLPPSSPARLLIDSSSLPLISGSTIDYATELIGSSFRVKGNPHASDKGGCGCGVSWELKE